MKKTGWGILVSQKEPHLGDGDAGHGVMHDGPGPDRKSMSQIRCDKHWRARVESSRRLLASGTGERRYEKQGLLFPTVWLPGP